MHGMLHLRDENLLLLLERLDELDGHLQRLGGHLRGSQGQPLSEGDVGDAVRLVDLDPDEILRLGGVLDVVARIVGEDGRIAGVEVKGARVAVASEDSGPGLAGVEVEPLLGLWTSYQFMLWSGEGDAYHSRSGASVARAGRRA